MSLAVVLTGLALLQLPWLLRGRLAQLSPTEWTRATSIDLRAGLALVQLGLLATAAPTRTPSPAPSTASRCARH